MSAKRKATEKLTATAIAVRLGILSILLNCVLAVGKLIVGNLLGYNSVTSDGIHGFSDVFTTVIAIIAIRIAARPVDSKYNYGYERYSSIFSVILAVVLAFIAIMVGVEAVEDLVSPSHLKVETDALFWVTLAILASSIVVKGIMFAVTRHGARLARSDAMLADAWHQLIDALSSVGAIGGLLGGLYGIYSLDSVFSLLIVLMILKVAFDIGVKGVRELTDQAVDKTELDSVLVDLETVIGPGRVDHIKSRIFAESYYLELGLKTSGLKTVAGCNEEAEKIRTLLHDRHPRLRDIHIDYLPE